MSPEPEADDDRDIKRAEGEGMAQNQSPTISIDNETIKILEDDKIAGSTPG